MALVIGVITQVLISPTTASLAVAPASGGVAPFLYQWYRSTVPNFVPSPATLLAGATSLTIIDQNLLPNSIYYYAVVATDSTPVTPLTVTTTPFGLCTSKKDQVQYQGPSVADFQTKFFRDFPFDLTFTNDQNKYIFIQDILSAMQQANSQINSTLYLNQVSFAAGNLWLTAHRLCVNINNSSQGLNGRFNWGETSKGVGPASQSFGVPEKIQSMPYLYAFCNTNYGADYALDLYPRLTGGMSSTRGWTKA